MKNNDFITLLLRISGVHIILKRKINESAAKATGAGIIFGKRKGGIRALFWKGPRP